MKGLSLGGLKRFMAYHRAIINGDNLARLVGGEGNLLLSPRQHRSLRVNHLRFNNRDVIPISAQLVSVDNQFNVICFACGP